MNIKQWDSKANNSLEKGGFLTIGLGLCRREVDLLWGKPNVTYLPGAGRRILSHCIHLHRSPPISLRECCVWDRRETQSIKWWVCVQLVNATDTQTSHLPPQLSPCNQTKLGRDNLSHDDAISQFLSSAENTQLEYASAAENPAEQSRIFSALPYLPGFGLILNLTGLTRWGHDTSKAMLLLKYLSTWWRISTTSNRLITKCIHLKASNLCTPPTREQIAKTSQANRPCVIIKFSTSQCRNKNLNVILARKSCN